MKRNTDIRKVANSSGVKLWEVAEKLGIPDTSFSKKLRKELSDTEKKRIIEIIGNIRTEKEG